MKRCTICKRSHPLTEFNFRAASSDHLQNVCRECNRKRSARYYREHREAHKATVTRRQRAAQQFLTRYLSGHPCVDCGEADLRVLEFDHVPGAIKTSEVGKMLRAGHGPERLLAEISQCEVRCRNCHAIATYERSGRSWRRDAELARQASVSEFVAECERVWGPNSLD